MKRNFEGARCQPWASLGDGISTQRHQSAGPIEQRCWQHGDPSGDAVSASHAELRVLMPLDPGSGHRLLVRGCPRLSSIIPGPRTYALVMRVLYVTSSGSSDPTRASIPLHLAVNGSVEIGHEVGLVLAGDATELLLPEVLDEVEGVGVPPARELLSKAREHEVPIYV